MTIVLVVFTGLIILCMGVNGVLCLKVFSGLILSREERTLKDNTPVHMKRLPLNLEYLESLTKSKEDASKKQEEDSDDSDTDMNRFKQPTNRYLASNRMIIIKAFRAMWFDKLIQLGRTEIEQDEEKILDEIVEMLDIGTAQSEEKNETTIDIHLEEKLNPTGEIDESEEIDLPSVDGHIHETKTKKSSKQKKSAEKEPTVEESTKTTVVESKDGSEGDDKSDDKESEDSKSEDSKSENKESNAHDDTSSKQQEDKTTSKRKEALIRVAKKAGNVRVVGKKVVERSAARQRRARERYLAQTRPPPSEEDVRAANIAKSYRKESRLVRQLVNFIKDVEDLKSKRRLYSRLYDSLVVITHNRSEDILAKRILCRTVDDPFAVALPVYMKYLFPYIVRSCSNKEIVQWLSHLFLYPEASSKANEIMGMVAHNAPNPTKLKEAIFERFPGLDPNRPKSEEEGSSSGGEDKEGRIDEAENATQEGQEVTKISEVEIAKSAPIRTESGMVVEDM